MYPIMSSKTQSSSWDSPFKETRSPVWNPCFLLNATIKMKNGSKPVLAEEVHIILAFWDSRGELKNSDPSLGCNLPLLHSNMSSFVGQDLLLSKCFPFVTFESWLDSSLALRATAVTARIFAKMSIAYIVTKALNFSYHFSLFYFYVESTTCVFAIVLANFYIFHNQFSRKC